MNGQTSFSDLQYEINMKSMKQFDIIGLAMANETVLRSVFFMYLGTIYN